MNEEQKRIKLFEATGWKYIEPVKPKSPFITYPKNLPRWKKGRKIAFKDDVPKYFEDLNEVHELEKILSPRDKLSYCHRLEAIVNKHLDGDSSSAWLYSMATAAQRCEAIGLTLNLWT